MEKSITYYELLTLVKNNEAPECVRFAGEMYYMQGSCGYISPTRAFLGASFVNPFNAVNNTSIVYDDDPNAKVKNMLPEILTITKDDLDKHERIWGDGNRLFMAKINEIIEYLNTHQM